MSDYSVQNEADYARTYDEDEMIQVRRGDLRAVLDVATMSMDFASGFLENEQVEALRKMGALLDIDPLIVTPYNFVCQYRQQHEWEPMWKHEQEMEWCAQCHHTRPLEGAE